MDTHGIPISELQTSSKDEVPFLLLASDAPNKWEQTQPKSKKYFFFAFLTQWGFPAKQKKSNTPSDRPTTNIFGALTFDRKVHSRLTFSQRLVSAKTGSCSSTVTERAPGFKRLRYRLLWSKEDSSKVNLTRSLYHNDRKPRNTDWQNLGYKQIDWQS